jgi:hypothetical protein
MVATVRMTGKYFQNSNTKSTPAKREETDRYGEITQIYEIFEFETEALTQKYMYF